MGQFDGQPVKYWIGLSAHLALIETKVEKTRVTRVAYEEKGREVTTRQL